MRINSRKMHRRTIVNSIVLSIGFTFQLASYAGVCGVKLDLFGNSIYYVQNPGDNHCDFAMRAKADGKYYALGYDGKTMELTTQFVYNLAQEGGGLINTPTPSSTPDGYYGNLLQCGSGGLPSYYGSGNCDATPKKGLPVDICYQCSRY